MNYIKNRCNNFKSDKLQLISTMIAAFLLCCHVYQMHDSNFQIDCIIRVVFFSLYIPVVFFSGQKGVKIMLLILSLTLMQFSTFNNYGLFFLICLLCFWNGNKKSQWIYLTLYAVDVLVVCVRHDKTPIHLIIHYVNCTWLYCLMWLVTLTKFKIAKLKLTEDERKILEVLASGNQEKSIDFCSKNTITRKLDAAQKRNNCNKTELIFKYMVETRLFL